MGVKPKKPESNKEEEEEVNEIEDSIIKDMKSERFFSELVGLESFVVTVYKEGDKGKKIKVKKFYNTIPDEFTDVRDIYGGGDYHFYAHLIENGKAVKLLDYTKNHLIADPDIAISGSAGTPGDPAGVNPDNARSKILEEMVLYKNLFSLDNNSNNNNNEILMAMMKNQTEATKTMMTFQLESEKRMASILEKIGNSNKSSLSELAETIGVIDSIRGTGGENQNMLQQIISSGALPGLIEAFTETTKKPDVPQAEKVIEEAPAESGPSSNVRQLPNVTVNQLADSVPEEVKEKINDDSRDYYINHFFEQNKSSISKEIIEMVVQRIINLNKEIKDNGIVNGTGETSG